MRSINNILGLFLILFSSCSEQLYRSNLVPDSQREVLTKTTGYYTTTSTISGNFVEGELIAVSNDSIYLLTYTGMEVESLNELSTINIFLTDTRTKKHLRQAMFSGLLSLFSAAAESDYAEGFLFIGLISAGSQLLAAAAESTKQPHLERFSSPIYRRDLEKFARFPKGFPIDYDPKVLDRDLSIVSN